MDLVANRLKELREERGLSLQKMADLVGCSKSQVHRFENGDDELSVGWMRKIAGALGLKPSQLLIDADVEFRAGPVETDLRDKLRDLNVSERGLFLSAATEIMRIVRRAAEKRDAVSLYGDRLQVSQLADMWNDMEQWQRDRTIDFLQAAQRIGSIQEAAE